MAIDKETTFRYLSITQPDTKEILKKLRTDAEEFGFNESKQDDEPRELLIHSDTNSQETEVYYFDRDGELNYSGKIGDGWISFVLKISDKVLIDILEYSMKRFSKLKTALETLN